jgi:hypothetical protein
LAIALALFGSAAFLSTFSQTRPSALELLCRVDSVSTKVPNNNIVIPVYMNNVTDSVAAFQLWVVSTNPELVRFAVDSTHGGTVFAKYDTAGTRSHGCGVSARIMDPLQGIVKVQGYVLPPPYGPGAIPPGDGMLIKLIAETNAPPGGYSVVPIMLEHTQTQFSNPNAQLIGCNYDSLGQCHIDTTKLVLRDGKVLVYLCGDMNEDGMVDISDPIYLLQCIFATCDWMEFYGHIDANCDSAVDISDIVYLILYIFSGGPAPCATCP